AVVLVRVGRAGAGDGVGDVRLDVLAVDAVEAGRCGPSGGAVLAGGRLVVLEEEAGEGAGGVAVDAQGVVGLVLGSEGAEPGGGDGCEVVSLLCHRPTMYPRS